MFGGKATDRIVRAEAALAAGRLDEAASLVSASDGNGDRRTQKLLGKLVEGLLVRGQDHLLGRRFREAMADFVRAGQLGHQEERVKDWQRRGREALAEHERAERQRAELLADGRDRLAAGSLGGAAEARGRLKGDDTQAAALGEAIERQTERARRVLAAAETALQDDRIVEAAQGVQEARRLHRGLDGLADLEKQIVDRVAGRGRGNFIAGRLDRAEQDARVLSELGEGRGEQAELNEMLRMARGAAEAVSEDHYARAGVLLGRLMQIVPDAKWVGEARERLDALEENRRTLLAGPLGLISKRSVSTGLEAQSEADGDTPTAIAQPPRCGAPAQAEVARGVLPRRLVLRIDGVGSFLLLRGERISVGRAGPAASADLELISDLSERHAEIIRAGEDYFVVASAGVELAGRRVEHALLQDGDRVQLGKRVRLRFMRPSHKSTTAALELGEGVRTTGDCRRVILWSGPVILGSGRDCHIHLGNECGTMVLMERGGQVCIKPMGPHGEAVPLALGRTVELGDLRLSLAAVNANGSFGRVIG